MAYVLYVPATLEAFADRTARMERPVLTEVFADRVARIDTSPLSYATTPMREPLSPRITVGIFTPVGAGGGTGGGGGSALNRGLN